MLADGGGDAGQGEVALGDHGDVADGELQWAAALLAGDEAGDGAVDLAGQKTLRAYRDEAQHLMEGGGDGQVGGQRQRLLPPGAATVGEGLLGDVAEQGRQLDIDRGGVVGGVVDDEAQIAGDPPEHLAADLLALADGLEALDVLRLDEEAVALLVLGDIDLQHRHGRVADADVADLHPAAGLLHQLLEDVGRPPGPLVVDDLDEAAVAHFVAGADDAVHLLFHLGVAALHGVEVEARLVLALQHARGGAAAEADAVGRAAHLDDEHALLRLGFLGEAAVDLADAAGEHDRLEEAPALAVA